MNRLGGLGKVLLTGALIALTFTVGSASATLPGKNGPLLVSGYIKGGINGNTSNVFTETLNGKSKTLLGSLDQSYSSPAVSPDGKQIVYSVYPGYRMWLGPFAKPLKAKAITPEEADVSPDGRFLAYNRGNDEDKSKIRLLDTKTGKSHTVNTAGPALSPTFSPDGKWLTYTAPVGDAWEVFRSQLNGKKAKRLTTTGAINFNSFYSPDGKLIAFTQGTDGERKIGVLTLKTGKTSTSRLPVTTPTWSSGSASSS